VIAILARVGQTDVKSLREGLRLSEQRREAGQNFRDDVSGSLFQSASATSGEIQYARLIAADDPRRFEPAAGKRYRKSRGASERTAARDRQNYGKVGQPIEPSGRNDQDRPRSLLFVAQGRIERNQVNIASLHQMSSRPTGPSAAQAKSSSLGFAEGSHCASNSSSE